MMETNDYWSAEYKADILDELKAANEENEHLRDWLVRLRAERDALLAQLPDEMKHCTIRFIECEKGHGRLTADNWIDHGCKKCQLDALEAEQDELRAAVEAAEADAERLAGRLRECKQAIATMPEDALGMASVDGRYEWPIRNELLSYVDAALAAHDAGGK
jgi:septal ring factor EnvC (AmiA/AmiB activator)